jgi:hypothetical protein
MPHHSMEFTIFMLSKYNLKYYQNLTAMLQKLFAGMFDVPYNRGVSILRGVGGGGIDLLCH